MQDEPGTAPPETPRCAECNAPLAEGQDRQVTDGGTFCRPCFEKLTAHLHQAIAAQGEGINYPSALLGGLVGAVLGVLAWWGFTVVTHIAFGLVAVVIGFAVGKGVTMLSGGKRHLNLQIMAVAISVPAFVYATYLVDRTGILRFYAEQGEPVALPWVPPPDVLYRVVESQFRAFDLIFLAIVIFQAWRMPAPIRLAESS